jgi:hypothetical protein
MGEREVSRELKTKTLRENEKAYDAQGTEISAFDEHLAANRSMLASE